MSVISAVSGLARPSTFAPNKPRYIANMGEPQQPIAPSRLRRRSPTNESADSQADSEQPFQFRCSQGHNGPRLPTPVLSQRLVGEEDLGWTEYRQRPYPQDCPKRSLPDKAAKALLSTRFETFEMSQEPCSKARTCTHLRQHTDRSLFHQNVRLLRSWHRHPSISCSRCNRKLLASSLPYGLK